MSNTVTVRCGKCGGSLTGNPDEARTWERNHPCFTR
jgi:hypothetical protein